MTVTRRSAAPRGPLFGANKNAPTSLSFTLHQRVRELRISEEALDDPSYRDELIALGLNPTGIGQAIPASRRDCARRCSSTRAATPPATCSTRVEGLRGSPSTLEQAGGWLQGDYDYNEATLEGRYYRPARQPRRARGEGARRVPIGGAGVDIDAELAVPFFKRYFLGGATNLRGWGRFDVSPLSGSGCRSAARRCSISRPSCACRSWATSAASLFLDGGNVWTDPGTSTSTTCATTSVPACATTRRSARSASTSATS